MPLLLLLLSQGSLADYARADAPAPDFLRRAEVRPVWSGTRFWYRIDLPGGVREYWVVDAEAGTRRPAFDAAKVADLGPVDHIAFDGPRLLLAAGGKGWSLNLETYERVPAPPPPAPPRERSREPGLPDGEAPEGPRRVELRDHNLWLDGAALTRDGRDGDAYSPRVRWSPDGKRLVAVQTRKPADRLLQFVESRPKDQLQPKLHTLAYNKPGDPLPERRPRLFDVETREEIPLDAALYPQPWSLDQIRWTSPARFTFRYNARGHQALRLLEADATSGRVRALIDETSRTFIDYAHKAWVAYLDKTREILWSSERDGWNHLYLFDADTGALKRQLTKGPWVVRGVDRLDVDARHVWFRAGGIRPGQDPYHVHVARVSLDGGEPVILTEGDGTHAVEYSPDRRFLIDTWSRVDLPPRIELRRTSDGSLVCPLETAEIDPRCRLPERFAAKGRDGSTDIYGILHRPSSFDPAKRYPVIESIYAGPQDSHVPKAFRARSSQQSLAEIGFIVVQIDGMGTSNRSKAFHDVCWKNLADAGFPDRIAWMKSAATTRPWMDLTRVGIYGGSAGGQNALGALLTQGDFYKVAVASCGCHDNRMDKVWWNELWMGWPVGPHYAAQSNVTLAPNLKGKLLLMVGELDRNVDPASTLQVVDALIKADKDFDLLIVPGAGHGGEGRYGERRRRDFFVRHLWGVEPRARP